VFDNVAFPLTDGVRKMKREDAREQALKALSLVQLEELADRPAPYLSGGQQQRVALARALALEPSVLLLDEPLSNLDAKLREEMRHELKTLVRRLGITTLYVTHDQLEALSMSDRVALMHAGVIEQVGKPRDVYQAPSSSFAARFLGRTNVLDGVATPHGVRTEWGVFTCVVPEWAGEGTKVALGFRPESAVLWATAPARGDNVVAGTVTGHTFNGENVEYQIEIGGKSVNARGDPFTMIADGGRAYLVIPPERCFVLAISDAHARVTMPESEPETPPAPISAITDPTGRLV